MLQRFRLYPQSVQILRFQTPNPYMSRRWKALPFSVAGDAQVLPAVSLREENAAVPRIAVLENAEDADPLSVDAVRKWKILEGFIERTLIVIIARSY